MTDRTIRVGFIGAGANSRKHHIPKLGAQPGVELAAVANRTKASGEQVAREFGIARVYGDWRELVRAPDIDAVCIGTWPNTHCEITRAVLEQGKHVLCEARMAMNVAEARSMLDAARRAPALVKQLVPGPNTLEVDPTVQKLLADGYVGDVLAVEIQAHQGRFVDAEEPLHWRQDAALSGLNVMTMGIWYEALMRWLGPARRVNALTRIAVPRRKDATGAWQEVRVPDHVEILATLGRDAVVHMRVSTVTALAPPHGGVDLRDRGHTADRVRCQAALGRTARRPDAERDPDSGRASDRLARRGRVRQRDPRARAGLAHHVRGRRALHGVHGGRGEERRQRPGGRRRRALTTR